MRKTEKSTAGAQDLQQVVQFPHSYHLLLQVNLSVQVVTLKIRDKMHKPLQHHNINIDQNLKKSVSYQIVESRKFLSLKRIVRNKSAFSIFDK